MAGTAKRRRLELLACAIWAKEKCTTRYGIDIDAWLNMHRDAKKMWIAKARAALEATKNG